MHDLITEYLDGRRDFVLREAPLTRAATPIGVSPSQAVMLVLLVQHGSQPISQLMRTLSIAPQSGTDAADRLQRGGLVCRVKHPTDRRIVRLALTTKGEKVAAAFVAALGEV
jgi:DNA-binding MarR family transcriptional regulator